MGLVSSNEIQNEQTKKSEEEIKRLSDYDIEYLDLIKNKFLKNYIHISNIDRISNDKYFNLMNEVHTGINLLLKYGKILQRDPSFFGSESGIKNNDDVKKFIELKKILDNCFEGMVPELNDFSKMFSSFTTCFNDKKNDYEGLCKSNIKLLNEIVMSFRIIKDAKMGNEDQNKKVMELYENFDKFLIKINSSFNEELIKNFTPSKTGDISIDGLSEISNVEMAGEINNIGVTKVNFDEGDCQYIKFDVYKFNFELSNFKKNLDEIIGSFSYHKYHAS